MKQNIETHPLAGLQKRCQPIRKMIDFTELRFGWHLFLPGLDYDDFLIPIS
jgi:hypothetical protein